MVGKEVWSLHKPVRLWTMFMSGKEVWFLHHSMHLAPGYCHSPALWQEITISWRKDCQDSVFTRQAFLPEESVGQLPSHGALCFPSSGLWSTINQLTHSWGWAYSSVAECLVSAYKEGPRFDPQYPHVCLQPSWLQFQGTPDLTDASSDPSEFLHT